MKDEIVLMISFGRIEALKRLYPSHDVLPKGVGLVELSDVSLGDRPLSVIAVEDRRAILRPGIRSLVIELGRVVRYGEINLQDLTIGDNPRIESDLDGFGMSGASRTHVRVMR